MKMTSENSEHLHSRVEAQRDSMREENRLAYPATAFKGKDLHFEIRPESKLKEVLNHRPWGECIKATGSLIDGYVWTIINGQGMEQELNGNDWKLYKVSSPNGKILWEA